MTIETPVTIQGYESVKYLAQGSQGQVFLATDCITKQRTCIKRIPKVDPITHTTRSQRRIQNEVSILETVNGHQGIPHFYRSFEDDTYYHLVFDFVEDATDVYELMKAGHFSGLSEYATKKIITQVINILSYCHLKNVAHKDIKMENIMYSSNQKAYLIDFGLSTFGAAENVSRDFSGTLEYQGPEIHSHTTFCPMKADIYALGVTIFAMLTGKFPFKEEIGSPKFLHEIQKKGPHFSPAIKKKLSPEVRDLLTKMLNPHPDERPCISEIKKHAWFQASPPSLQMKKSSSFSKLLKAIKL